MKMVELSFSAMFTRYTFKFLIIAVISCHFTNSYEYQPGIVNPVLNDDPIDDQESNQHLDTSILQVSNIASIEVFSICDRDLCHLMMKICLNSVSYMKQSTIFENMALFLIIVDFAFPPECWIRNQRSLNTFHEVHGIQ